MASGWMDGGLANLTWSKFNQARIASRGSSNLFPELVFTPIAQVVVVDVDDGAIITVHVI